MDMHNAQIEDVLVLGDSHSEVFARPRFKQKLPNVNFIVASARGATLSGLTNPNSNTQAGPIFKSAVDRYAGKRVLTLMGEVDTGFVIWYRAERDGADPLVAAKKSVQNYQALLLDLMQKFPKVGCVSTPLPTIRDGQDYGEVANARKLVKASQRSRTELTLYLNHQMSEFCKEQGIAYLDLDSESLGEGGLVREELLSQNKLNHHYEPAVYVDLLAPKVRSWLSA